MRTRTGDLDRFQAPVPEDYPWQMMRRLTEASSSTEVLRSAITCYAELFDCEREGRSILMANKDGVYQTYTPFAARHDNLKRINLLMSIPVKTKVEFMAAAKAMDKYALIRDALAFYRKIVMEAAFERPVMIEDNGKTTPVLFTPLVNVSTIAKRMGLGAKKPDLSPT